MTADSSSTSSLAAHVGGSSEDGPTDLRAVGSETFDVEPPYDAAAPDLDAATGSWTASCPGCTSTAGCSSSPRTRACRCWSGCGSWRSSPRTSTSSSWCGSPASSGGSPPGSPYPPRPGLLPREVLEQIWTHDVGADGAARRAVPRRDRPGARQGGHRAGALGRPRPATSRRQLQEALQGAGLPGADAAGRRPRAPVPLHLRAVAEPRRAGAQPEDRQGALRPGQGAADLRALRARRRRSASCRSRTSSASTSSGCSPAWRCSACTPSG